MTQRLEWRSHEFIEMLRTCDILQLTKKFTEDGRVKVQSFPRRRITGTLVSERPPVSHLPISCYDRNWLNTLDEEATADLQMNAETVDLTVSPAVQE